MRRLGKPALLAIANRKSKITNPIARVAKLADAPDLGSVVRPSCAVTSLVHERRFANRTDHFRHSKRQHSVNGSASVQRMRDRLRALAAMELSRQALDRFRTTTETRLLSTEFQPNWAVISARPSLYIRQLSNLQPIPIPSEPLLQTASGLNARKALASASCRVS
jgi:hypothetical protein